jgi:hypothetical protein
MRWGYRAAGGLRARNTEASPEALARSLAKGADPVIILSGLIVAAVVPVLESTLSRFLPGRWEPFRRIQSTPVHGPAVGQPLQIE